MLHCLKVIKNGTWQKGFVKIPPWEFGWNSFLTHSRPKTDLNSSCKNLMTPCKNDFRLPTHSELLTKKFKWWNFGVVVWMWYKTCHNAKNSSTKCKTELIGILKSGMSHLVWTTIMQGFYFISLEDRNVFQHPPPTVKFLLKARYFAHYSNWNRIPFIFIIEGVYCTSGTLKTTSHHQPSSRKVGSFFYS